MIMIVVVVVVVVVVVSWYRENMQKRYKNVPATLPCLSACLSVHTQLGKPEQILIKLDNGKFY